MALGDDLYNLPYCSLREPIHETSLVAFKVPPTRKIPLLFEVAFRLTFMLVSLGKDRLTLQLLLKSFACTAALKELGSPYGALGSRSVYVECHRT